jgi:DNA-binding CsgD family transcriptional regulator/tetratricopeptide (TPR) repeat protein
VPATTVHAQPIVSHRRARRDRPVGAGGGHADGLPGRDAECAAVRQVLDDAREQRGAALVLCGEPGIGKSTLLDHAVAHAGGMVVLRATGVEAERFLAHAGVHQLVAPVADRIDALPPPQARALGVALGREGGAHDPFMVSAALVSLVSAVAEERPVLVVVDDLHWLDRASASALSFTARRLQATQVALLLATRARVDGAMADAAPLPHLHLRGLPPDAAATVLDHRLPSGVPPHVRRRLLALAAGNPLALRELPAALSPAQLAGREMLPDPVPVTSIIEDAFLQRASSVSPPAHTLLLVAAAERLGDVGLVLRAGRTLGCDASALAEVEDAGLLVVVDNELRFRHPLMRSALYRRAGRALRQAVHAALADGLGGAADRDRRAWHRASAGIGPDEAIAAELERSTDRALRRNGHATAATILELAAERSPRPADVARRLVAAAAAACAAGDIERVGALVDRAAPLCDDPPVMADIALLRADCERAVGTAGRAYEILVEACDQVADRDPRRALTMATAAGTAAWGRSDGAQLAGAVDRVLALTRDTAAPPPATTQALLACASAFTDDLDAAVQWTTGAVVAAERSGRAADRSMTGAAAMAIGDDATCLRLLRRAAADARPDGGIAILTATWSTLAVAEAWTGHLRSARAHATDGLLLATQTGHLAHGSLCEAVLAWIAAASGDHDECARLAVRAARRGLEQELAMAVAIAGWSRGLAALGTGRPDEAHGHLSELVIRHSRSSHPLVAVAATGDIVEAAVAVGDDATAASAMAALDRFVVGTGQPWACAVLSRCRAATCATGGEKLFAAALRHHADGSRPFEHGRTLLAYGGWLRRRRRRIDARVHLRGALRVFECVGATDWADRARRELRASGETVGRAASVGVATLTPQEVQVVQFVRTGATNKQIAAQLYLSPRTVDYHLRKVFVKLGVSSRAELIAQTAEASDRGRRDAASADR